MDLERRSAEQLAAAIEHQRAGRLAEAERLYRLVAAADPQNVRALHLLGVVGHQLGRRDAADLVGRALALRPDLAELHNDHGVILAAQGRIGEAAAAFERAVTQKPEYAEARNNLASAFARLGRLDEAVTQLERVRDGAPDAPLAHANLAMALRRQGRLAD